jgi:hypothetical protein
LTRALVLGSGFTCKICWASKNKVAPLEGKLMCHPTMHQHSYKAICSISFGVKKVGEKYF